MNWEEVAFQADNYMAAVKNVTNNCSSRIVFWRY